MAETQESGRLALAKANWRRRLDQRFRKFFQASPQRLLAGVFALAILAGALLLWLPCSHRAGQVGLMDALFTSTSAVCVTGLAVADTGNDFNLFGQLVILLLIQVGGLGIMTFAALAFELGGARMPLAQRAAVEDSFFQRDVASEFPRMFRRILFIVLAVELTGAALLFPAIVATHSLAHSVWSAAFHSVSAFCNAGFSLYSDSLSGFSGCHIFLTAVMTLIVLGGLGHVVLLEVYREMRRVFKRQPLRHPRRFSLHTRVVLIVSAALVVAGTALLALCGCGTEGWFAGALFQSISARTAGFNTVDLAALPLSSLMLLAMLMLIGGSPGSCAGGIKTTTFAIWLVRIRSALRGQEDVTILDRLIPRELVLRAVALVSLTVLWNVAGVVLLSWLQPEGTQLRDIVFEQVSAFGTVGLSTGLTAQLTSAARLWIILTMFVGRLGPLTLVFSFLTASRAKVGCPEGRVMIG